MKVKNIVELKSNFSFEAPIVSAEKIKGVSKSNGKLIDLNNFLAPIAKEFFFSESNR